jgi:hypothetical protein
VLALMSMEQAYAVPLVLGLYVLAFGPGHHVMPRHRGPAPAGNAPRASAMGDLERLLPLAGALFVYGAFMAFWKGIPHGGPYAFSGSHVLLNAATYTGWSHEFWMTIPNIMSPDHIALSPSHLVLLAVVAYHLARRRWGVVLFGIGYYALAILPTLFLSQHTFLLHTYIPMVGIVYLLSVAIDDALRLRTWRPGVAYAIAVFVIAVYSWGSANAVRRNERATLSDTNTFTRSFVLRRAKIAENAHRDIARKVTNGVVFDRVQMVYGGRPEALWNMNNFQGAVGNGGAIRLTLGNPGAVVTFHTTAKLPPVDTPRTLTLFYTDFGNCFTLDEVQKRR